MFHPIDLPILNFSSPEKWEEWLSKNQDIANGIWFRFFKKASGKQKVNYAQALDVALCYGWIDGQVQRYDEESYLQRFTPRRSRSMWSKINTQNVERLIKAGKMKPAGLKQIEAAKADGRWEKAYHSPSNAIIPEDFLKAVAKNKKAQTFFKTLNKSNTYAIAYQLQTAKKEETRLRRMKVIIEKLEKEEKFH